MMIPKGVCDVCGDLGVLTCPGCDGVRVPCARCHGTGTVVCPACETVTLPCWGISVLEEALRSAPAGILRYMLGQDWPDRKAPS